MRYSRESQGGGKDKTWCEDYGDVVALYLSVREREIHEYVTREDLDAATLDGKGNVTIFVHEGAYSPEDYDHYMDMTYAVYLHTRRYEVTMPIEVLRDKAMRGLLQHRATYVEYIRRNRYPSLPPWLLENKREITRREEGGELATLSLEPQQRIPLSAPRRMLNDLSVSYDFLHRIHAVYAQWPGFYGGTRAEVHPIAFWNTMRRRSTGNGRDDSGPRPFTAEAELIPIDPTTVLSRELLGAEPKDRSWTYGDMYDYLLLSDIVHHWGIDIVCLGSACLPDWWGNRNLDLINYSHVQGVIVFGEDYPGCCWTRFAPMGVPLASSRERNRPCALLKMHNRVWGW